MKCFRNIFLVLTTFVVFGFKIEAMNIFKSSHDSTYLVVLKKEKNDDHIKESISIYSIKNNWLNVKLQDNKNVYSLIGDTLFYFDDDSLFFQKNEKALNQIDDFTSKIEHGNFKTNFENNIILENNGVETIISFYLCKLKITTKSTIKKKKKIANYDKNSLLMISSNYESSSEGVQFID